MRRVSVLASCDWCGEKFSKKPSDKKRFCSPPCSWESFKVFRPERECQVCGSMYRNRNGQQNQRFCSKPCRCRDQSMGLVKTYSHGRYGYRSDLGDTLMNHTCQITRPVGHVERSCVRSHASLESRKCFY